MKKISLSNDETKETQQDAAIFESERPPIMRTMKHFLLLLGCGLATSLMAQPAQPTVPHLINYQGILVDSTGTNLADGNYVLTFNIYSNAVGGVPAWGPQIFDGQSGFGHSPTVALIGGRFN